MLQKIVNQEFVKFSELNGMGLNLDPGLTFEEWENKGWTLGIIQAGNPWWIGDWLNYGEKAYGEKYSQAIELIGLDYQTLADYKWVAGRITFSRRRENLSIAIATEIAGIKDQSEQDQWIDWAFENGKDKKPCGRRHLRQAIRAERNRKLAAEAEERLIGTPQSWRLYNKPCIEAAGFSEPVDWIITDPPYLDEFIAFYDDLGQVAAKVLKPGGSLLCMVGQYHLPRVIEHLSRHLNYQWMLAYMTPGAAVQIFPRHVSTNWKPILWFVKGAYAGKWCFDVCTSHAGRGEKEHHDWGQTESGMADLMRRFVNPGDLIMDPFVGGGTTGVVALKLKCRFVGYDSDENAYNESLVRLSGVTQ